MDEDDLEFYNVRKKPPYSPDLHLKTAIRGYERAMFVNGFLGRDVPIHFPIRKCVTAYQRFQHKPTGSIRQDSEYIYGSLLSPNLTNKSKGAQFTRSLDDNTRLAKVIIKEAIRDLFTRLPELKISKEKLIRDFSQFDITREIKEWFVYRNIWEAIRDIMKDAQVSEEYQFREVAKGLMKGRVFVNPYFMIYQENHNTCWLLDYNQILMLSDTIGSRFLTLLYCSLHETLRITPMPTVASMRELYDLGDRLLTMYGNEGYNHIKQLESLCVANYLARFEPLKISREYINQLRDEAGDDPSLLSSLNEIYDLLTRIGEHPLELFEIFGSFRHFGHPTVDELEGIKSLRENSQLKIEVDPDQLAKVSGAFNRMIILEFIATRKRWPKCTLNPACKNLNMMRLVTSKPTAISEYDLVIPLKEWSFIEFDQEFQFDDFPDFTSLLSDTAISPYLEHWYTVFSSDLLNVRQPMNVEESRRVLIEVLRREKIDCQEIRKIIQTGNIPDSWKIIGLHSKERELKIKARLFAMMCLEMRLYFNMTEKNLAEKIFPLIPYQTMTWTDAELTKVMLNLSSLHSEKDKAKLSKFVYVIISLDFNKFNQKWRYESTEPIFKNIDRLFGTPGLLEFSHKFFKMAFFYLSSNLRPPEYLTRKSGKKQPLLPDISDLIFKSETTWLGQDGGCEGLRQKGWTAVIVSALVANAFDTGVEGQIIGQGDNQVIVASFRVPLDGMSAEDYIINHERELTGRVEAYLENLKRITNGIGMDLKLQESWVSTTLLNYGKEIIVDGSFTSCAIKKISRAYQDVSELYPSLPNRVASIFTTAQSASMKSFDTASTYFIALIDGLNMISKEGKYGTTMEGKLKQLFKDECIQLDDHLKLVCLLLPRECGGLPVIPYLNMHFRGHPDQATSSLLWLKKLSQQIPQAKRILDLITSGYFNAPKIDYLQLIQDPYSLNFSKPIQSSNRIKHALVTTMRMCTRNQDVSMMMDACNEESLTEIANYLSKCQPLFPRVLNEILRLSPDGSMQSFLAIFRDMRTMKQMLDPHAACDLVNKLKQSDLDLMKRLIQISKLVRYDSCHKSIEACLGVNPQNWLQEKQNCTTQLAQELRDVSWGKRVEGVSIPHPSEQSGLFLAEGDTCSYPSCQGDEMIVYVVMDNRDRPEQPIHFDKGSLRHYLGSGTSEKRSGPVLNFPKTEKAIRAAQQLLRVLNWTVDKPSASNTLYNFLEDLIKSRCDADKDFLLLTSGVNYGGSVQHRFSDVTSKHESRPGIRVNNHARVRITSDQLGKYARGKDNYSIVFQSLYLSALHLINIVLLTDPSVIKEGNLVFHQHLICDGCLEQLNEPPMVNSERPPHVPELSNCSLVYARVGDKSGAIGQACIENTPTVEPQPGDPDIHRKSAYAAALLIVGETSHFITPLLHSDMKRQHRDGTLVCLTVGYFLKIGMKHLFEQLAVVWFLDTLPEIVNIAIEYQSSLVEAAEILIDRYPDNAWEIMKPYICLSEVQREARIKIELASTSSEIFITGKGLGYAISQAIANELKKIIGDSSEEIKRKPFMIPFVSTTPGITLNRCIYMWVNSCVLLSNWETISQLKILIKIGQKCILDSLTVEGVDTCKLMLIMANVKSGKLNFKHAITSNRLLISKVGVEPWVMPQILPEKKKFSVSIAKQNPRVDDQVFRDAVLNIMEDIGLRTRINLGETDSTTENINLPEQIVYPERTSHSRADHYFRLVGTFSTAGLKYSQIYASLNIRETPASAHLAEGAGGVARMTSLLLGSTFIIYNSLIQIGTSLNHRVYDYKPAELQDLEHITVKGPTFCYQTGGDITKRSTITRYSNLIQKQKTSIKIITCDAEFPDEGTIQQARGLINSFLEMASKSEPGTLLIFKTFCRIREILLHQISIWSQSVRNPEILVPRFSSHESSEIFLIGQTSKMTTAIRAEISKQNVELIDAIIEVRGSTTPFLSNENRKKLRDLYLFFDYLGVKDNYYEALQIFLNFSVSETELRIHPLRAISQSIDHSRMRIDERAKLISRFQEATDLSKIQKLMVHSIRQDSREMHLGSETIFNANILRSLLVHSCIPGDFFTTDWVIECNDTVLYTYVPNWEAWIQSYGRCFFKIIGHLEIIDGRPLDLPPFVRVHLTQDS